MDILMNATLWVVRGVLPFVSMLVWWAATALLLYMVRDKKEVPHDNCWSSFAGDKILSFGFALMCYWAQTGGVLKPWMLAPTFYLVALGISVVLGIVWTCSFPEAPAGDRFHNMWIAPFVCYWSIVGAGLAWCDNQDQLCRLIFIICVLVWALMVVYDQKTGRADQPTWIMLNWRKYLEYFARHCAKVPGAKEAFLGWVVGYFSREGIHLLVWEGDQGQLQKFVDQSTECAPQEVAQLSLINFAIRRELYDIVDKKLKG